jgi:CBS-domain-containing membrane protein
LVIVVAAALGVTVAFLLTDVLAGVAVALGTAIVFRFVLRTINT